MVIFALTRHGLPAVLDHCRNHGSALWLNGGLLDAQQLGRLRAEGLDVTAFSHSMDPADVRAIQAAVETIMEHHPGQVVHIAPGAPTVYRSTQRLGRTW